MMESLPQAPENAIETKRPRRRANVNSGSDQNASGKGDAHGC